MPALDFPSSPTNGQVFGQYTYDSTKGAWRVTSQVGTAVVSSATPPTSPVAGNLWFNTNDGVLFVYYDDGNTSQWVEVKSNTASGSTVAARVDVLEQNPNITGTLTVAGTTTLNGNVKKPNNPAFNSVATFGASTFTNGAQIPFAQIITNKGNCYNTSTSRFTAPVAGTYSFTFSVYRYSGYTSQPTYRINGSPWGPADLALAVANTATADMTITLTMLATLAAGDYVDVAERNPGTGRYYAGHSFFMGHLLG